MPLLSHQSMSEIGNRLSLSLLYILYYLLYISLLYIYIIQLFCLFLYCVYLTFQQENQMHNFTMHSMVTFVIVVLFAVIYNFIGHILLFYGLISHT